MVQQRTIGSSRFDRLSQDMPGLSTRLYRVYVLAENWNLNSLRDRHDVRELHCHRNGHPALSRYCFSYFGQVYTLLARCLKIRLKVHNKREIAQVQDILSLPRHYCPVALCLFSKSSYSATKSLFPR